MADFNQIVSASPIIKIGNQTITYSTTEPASPANGDLWYEPGSRYPAPWEWESSSNLWLAQPQDISTEYEQVVNSTQRWTYPTEFYNSKYGSGPAAKLVFVNVLARAANSAHTATDYFTFNVEYLLGTGSYSTAYTTTTNTIGLNASTARRINETMSIYIPGNAWTIGIITYKVGSNANVLLNPFSAKFTIRYPRP